MQVRPLVKATQLNSRNALIIMVVMMFIALSIALATVAFVQNDELSEDDDDFLAIEGWAAIWAITFTPLSLVLNLDSEFLILAVIVEHLRSHIGEKRFGDRTIEFNKLSLIPDSLVTALFKVVTYFSFLRFYQIHVRNLTTALFPISRIHPTILFGEKISTQGGILL